MSATVNLAGGLVSGGKIDVSFQGKLLWGGTIKHGGKVSVVTMGHPSEGAAREWLEILAGLPQSLKESKS